MSLDLDRIPRWAPGPQARVDWSHPLAAGLLGVALANRIIYGYQGPVTGTGIAALAPTVFGNGRTVANAPNGLKVCDFPAQTDTSQFTLTYVGRFPTAAVPTLAGYRNGGGPGVTFTKLYRTEVQYYSNGNNRYTQAHGATGGTDAMVSLVKRGLVLEVWRNGGRVHASSAFTSGQLDQNAAVCYYTHGDEADNSPGAALVLSSLHDRALTGSEFAQLYADPFCFLTEA